MKRLLALLFVCPMITCGTTAQIKMLKNFDQLMFALRTGSEARAVIYYARCKLIIDSVETKAPDAVGGMSISTYEYFAPNSVRNPKAFVTTSQTMLISHPKQGHVYNYVKIKIYEDNAVEINAKYLNPTTYQVLMDETFYGAISAGDDGNAVCLYER
ncbi:MAG: hypothetical protein NTU47_08765 [Ignavibacteriales bacterium]|nr:hypothetical protein [Ignavibacteriales bacterium]